MSVAVLWLRRDLRLHDHPALRAAIDAADRVVPVFCFDDGLLKGRHASGSRTHFMLQCLKDLDQSLREREGRLLVRSGAPQTELPALARELGAGSVHFSADVSPFARRRQAEVKRALQAAGVEAVAHPGLFAVDQLDPIRTVAGEPYTVFTAFHRNWLGQPRRDVLGVPRSVPVPGNVCAGDVPLLSELGLEQECSDPMPGGEQAGREALRRFLSETVECYGERSRPAPGPVRVPAVALSALRMRLAPRGGASPPGRGERRRVQAPALLAGLLRPRAGPLSGQCAL